MSKSEEKRIAAQQEKPKTLKVFQRYINGNKVVVEAVSLEEAEKEFTRIQQQFDAEKNTKSEIK